jgi:hypothetical protein
MPRLVRLHEKGATVVRDDRSGEVKARVADGLQHETGR